MMTAKINFITNNLLVDMTCRETELRDSLQNIGILIMPSMITLDNRRTLQIQLKLDPKEPMCPYMNFNDGKTCTQFAPITKKD